MSKEQVAILDKAIELISPEGAWCGNSWASNSGQGQFDLNDALCAKKGSWKDRAAVFDLCKKEVGIADTVHWHYWNEHSKRTQQEVIDLLKRVRDKLA